MRTTLALLFTLLITTAQCRDNGQYANVDTPGGGV